MKVLIVDDQELKAQKLTKLITDLGHDVEISVATSATQGFQTLMTRGANLVLLDVVLPLSAGDEASEEGSLWFVREAKRKISGAGQPFIVGTTQYADSLAKVQETFRNDLWSIIYVNETDGRWRTQIHQAVRFARSNADRVSLGHRDGAESYNVAVIAALRTPEFSELITALGGGDQVFVDATSETWLRCVITREDGLELKVLAACADGMGMTAMSSLVTKVCVTCAPKKVILCGIMAGNSERVGLSDLVVVESTWNFQAGKLTESGFLPDVKSLTCGYKVANLVTTVLTEAFIVEFWTNWLSARPQQIAKVHSGDVACSPFVVAEGTLFAKLEAEQKRKILGLEMEAYGCYDAAWRLGDLAPEVVCVKSVCDFGDGAKDNTYQTYCAALSAAAVVRVIKDSRFTG